MEEQKIEIKVSAVNKGTTNKSNGMFVHQIRHIKNTDRVIQRRLGKGLGGARELKYSKVSGGSFARINF